MNRLILMRHATAERAAESGRDRDRSLTPEGRRDAILMGRILAEKGVRPDLALVSSAQRTRETWDLIQDAFGDVEVRIEPALYNAPADTLRRHVEGAEEEAACLLVLAHNPGVHMLAYDYLIESAASPSVMDRMAGGFPTAAAALFEVDVAGRCTYDGYLVPKAFGGGDDA
ncbi:histidine phosphatase family protein [soil metagenome]